MGGPNLDQRAARGLARERQDCRREAREGPWLDLSTDPATGYRGSPAGALALSPSGTGFDFHDEPSDAPIVGKLQAGGVAVLNSGSEL